jgi:hypothetical protein
MALASWSALVRRLGDNRQEPASPHRAEPDYTDVVLGSIAEPTPAPEVAPLIRHDLARHTASSDIIKLFDGRPWLDDPAQQYLHYHAERLAFIVDLIELYSSREAASPAELEVLDVGRPHLLTECIRHLIRPRTLRTIGFGEIPPGDVIDEHVTFDLNDAFYPEKWPAPREHDLVVFAETIEHLYTSPVLVLKCLSTFLRRRGLMVIQTPNAASIEKRLALLNGRNPYELIRDSRDNPGHFREYTPEELYALGTAAGLTCESVMLTEHWPREESHKGLVDRFPALRSGLTVTFQK